MELDSIESAIQAIAAGELVVVVDDMDRENEGDLIMAASKASPENVAFMIRHTSGILCVPMTAARADELNLAPMVANNIDPLRTAFTVSVDYRHGMTTGISAAERTNTITALANGNVTGADFIRPGHIFPLIARQGGVLARSGHTEAGVDLASMAGLPAAGVLAEIVNDDGTVKRLPELIEFAKEHRLKIISIEDLIAYRIRTERFVARVEEQVVQIHGAPAKIYSYASDFDPLHHVVLVFGDVRAGEDVPCRIHREQPMNEVVSRINGEPGWMTAAVNAIDAAGGRGVIMILRNPAGHDASVDDNGEMRQDGRDGEKHGSALARQQRWREVGVGAQILRDLGIRSIALIATSERQYVGLGGFGIEISRTILI